MAFVGETTNPWDVPKLQAVQVMQKIWDAISTRKYEITSDTPVYTKVCDQLAPGMNDIMVHFRRFNAFRTRGVLLSDPPASQ